MSKLPDAQRQAIEAEEVSGDSVILVTRSQRRKQRYQQKIAAAQKLEREILELEQMMEQVMDEEHVGYAIHRYQILDEVDHRLWYWPLLNRRDPARYPLPAPAANNADRTKVMRESRPAPRSDGEELFHMEVVIQQLTVGLLKIAPTPAARDEALRRLRMKYQHHPTGWIDTWSTSPQGEAPTTTV
jgi:hypothetical protein